MWSVLPVTQRQSQGRGDDEQGFLNIVLTFNCQNPTVNVFRWPLLHYSLWDSLTSFLGNATTYNEKGSRRSVQRITCINAISWKPAPDLPKMPFHADICSLLPLPNISQILFIQIFITCILAIYGQDLEMGASHIQLLSTPSAVPNSFGKWLMVLQWVTTVTCSILFPLPSWITKV